MATEINGGASPSRASQELSPNVQPLTGCCEPEVLSFLNERPFHTFGLSGLMLANGVASPHLRGTFYTCRGNEGALEGVALIGHSNLFETRTNAAMRAFARLTRLCPNAALVLGEEKEVSSFWTQYQKDGPAASVRHQEVLLELRYPVKPGNPGNPVPDLRVATFEDLDSVVCAHAQIGLWERGVNPLDVDADGFRQRCARRIELGRTWIIRGADRLIFKAEIVFATPKVAYLESIVVHPHDRGKGYGRRCLTQLAEHLLRETESICLLVQQRNRGALNFYKKVGFTPVANYTSLFLDRNRVHEV